MWLRYACLLFALCAITSVMGQMFQYSRGWTNGKRGGHLSREAACQQLIRLNSLVDGKSLPQGNWPCDWRSFGETGQSVRFNQQEQIPISTEADEN